MNIGDLSLRSIDGMRHMTTSDEIVTAVAFAARAGHSNVTAYRFVTALTVCDALKGGSPSDPKWQAILKTVMDLERAAKEADEQSAATL